MGTRARMNLRKCPYAIRGKRPSRHRGPKVGHAVPEAVAPHAGSLRRSLRREAARGSEGSRR